MKFFKHWKKLLIAYVRLSTTFLRKLFPALLVGIGYIKYLIEISITLKLSRIRNRNITSSQLIFLSIKVEG